MQPRKSLFRFLLPLCAALAGCTTTPIVPDYSTPEKTLLTFHEAFKQSEIPFEYECFSQRFKEIQGNMDLKSYYEVRKQFEDEYPLESFLFSLKDIEDNIKEKTFSPDGRSALLTLSIGGEDYSIWFIRETIYRFEFDQGRPFEDFSRPLEELIAVEGDALEVTLPLIKKNMKRLEALRTVIVEERWKFLDFSFLHGAPVVVE